MFLTEEELNVPFGKETWAKQQAENKDKLGSIAEPGGGSGGYKVIRVHPAVARTYTLISFSL